jgi:hypothetical protein
LASASEAIARDGNYYDGGNNYDAMHDLRLVSAVVMASFTVAGIPAIPVAARATASGSFCGNHHRRKEEREHK